MPSPPRMEYARRVLDKHPDDSNPTAHELSDSRYALVEHTTHYGRNFVTGHDSIEDALARASEGVLEEDDWWPKLLVDLDTGEEIADEGASGFHVEATVTIGPAAQPTVQELHELIGGAIEELRDVPEDADVYVASALDSLTRARELAALLVSDSQPGGNA